MFKGKIRPCACLVLARRSQYVEKIIPTRFRGVDIKRLQPSKNCSVSLDRQQKVIDLVKSDSLGSFMFLGPTGVGKTHLLYALVNEAIWHNRSVYVSTASELIRASREAEMGRGEFALTTEKLFEMSEHGTAHIFLDEMDKVKLTEYAQLFLFDIINYCYDNSSMIKISLTSNLTPQGFEEAYGAAFFRKLKVISHFVVYGK